MMKLLNQRNHKELASEVKKAESFWERSIGLLGRTEMKEAEGLWIQRCNNIHTHFMRFPIDAVFLDRNLKVVSIHENIVPWRFVFSKWKAASVIELTAGKIRATDIHVGDQLHVVD